MLAIDNELKWILNESKYSDKKLGIIELTEFKDRYIELRILVSARDATYLWNLRYEVREKILSYLLQHYPHCMPKLRITNE